MSASVAGLAGPVLGIETSCDETAAAVLAPDGRILAEALLSQQGHAPFGGVVPELAARAHLAHLPAMVGQVMGRAEIGFADLGGVAASAGPGLIGGLIVGSGFAKGVALAHRLPYVAVNHLEAHALTVRLPGLAAGECADRREVDFPYLLMLLSGGHCQSVVVRGVGQYELLGATIDDAVGEAFDKVGKLLGLGWPGGPAVERMAAGGDELRFDLPRPLLGRPGHDFSFSGLKTAVARQVALYPPGPLPARDASDLAASFQRAVADILEERAGRAMAAFAGGMRVMVVAGGVAANRAVRTALVRAAAAHGFSLIAPPARLCTDNAIMVAWAGIERLRLGRSDTLDHAARPRWPLAELAAG